MATLHPMTGIQRRRQTRDVPSESVKDLSKSPEGSLHRTRSLDTVDTRPGKR
jgi:hypothetical protein